jgi:hypothetical protein
MFTVEIVRGSCDHCAAKDVLVARLGFAQVAQVCQLCLATAEAEVYRAEVNDAGLRDRGTHRLPLLRGSLHS